MGIRLNKVVRELNVGIDTLIEFLRKKGYEVEANPNAKIDDKQYDLLKREFSKDKELKEKSEQVSRTRQKNEQNRLGTAEEQSDPTKKADNSSGDNAQDAPATKQKPSLLGRLNPFRGPRSSTNQSTPTAQPQPTTSKPAKPIETPTTTAPEPLATSPASAKPDTPTVNVDQAATQPEPAPTETPVATQATTPAEPTSTPAEPASKPQPTAEATPVAHAEEPATSVAGTDLEPDATQQTASITQQSASTVQESTKEDNPEQPADQPASTTSSEPEQAGTTQPELTTSTPDAKPKTEEVFTLDHTGLGPKINVVGKVDLDTINSSTRPPKKSKEDKKKEREAREKERMEQRKQMKENILGEIRGSGATTTPTKPSNANPATDASGKKKRTRIDKGKERIDITSTQSYQQPGDRSSAGGRASSSTQSGAGRSKTTTDRAPKPTPKPEMSEEESARQVNERLASLTSKGKNKSAKYRREKREAANLERREKASREATESHTLKLTEFVTANELANMMDVPVTKVIGTCMSVGIMVSINQRLDAETINLVAEEFGFRTEYVSAEVAQAIVEEADAEEDLLPRAPIVTVMGHVDHGKTSLLDYIRKSNVIAGEAGGITQHIGAYNVTLDDGRKLTFLDTPGHEAFTAMRARGAKVTDIAIIIVAADDSVMPQTKEAINHAMAAGVPIVFAINKIDKPGANPEKIKEELAAMNFLVEEWGGKYQSQDISAKKGIGVQELMEKVLLEAEMLELKANPNRRATGSVIESSLDRGRGYVATVLVSNGTLKTGDIVLAGTNYGRIKAMFNERNQRITAACPAEPALVLGLNGAPAAGDTFHVIETEQEAREIASKREQLQREQGLRTQKMLTLDEVGRRLALGDFHELNIIVKGDVDGSVEALSDSLIKLSTEQVQVNVIHKGVGQISESDVSLASASGAIIVGFQVRPSGAAAKQAEQDGVDIRKYSVIYDAIEEVKAAMVGMLAPTVKEQVTATLDVREVFNISKVGLVAGAMVKTGKIKRSDKVRLIRDGIVVFTGNINALKRFKDDVREVGTNFECGISLVSCNDIKAGDVIESFEEVEVKQTL